MIPNSLSSTSATSGPGFISIKVSTTNNTKEVEPIIDIPDIERVTEIDDKLAVEAPGIDTPSVDPVDIEDTIVCNFSSRLPTAIAHTTISLYEPTTYKEALESPNSHQ